MELVAKSDDDDYWNCEVCLEKQRIYGRNCQHEVFSKYTDEEVKKKAKKATKYSVKKQKGGVKKFTVLLPDNTKIDHCPMSHFIKDYYELVRLIYWSEEIGIMPYEPNALMEQSNVYVEARHVVIGQRSKISHLEDKKRKAEDEKKKKDTNNLRSR